MNDITMCTNFECEKRMKCRRFTAPVNEYRQSVCKWGGYQNSCNHFWNNESYNNNKDNTEWAKQTNQALKDFTEEKEDE